MRDQSLGLKIVTTEKTLKQGFERSTVNLLMTPIIHLDNDIGQILMTLTSKRASQMHVAPRIAVHC